jgi:hypothetical protein
MTNTTDFEIQDPEEWPSTDHQMLIMEMNTTGIINNRPKAKRKYCKIYNIKQATDQSWKEWKEST